MADEQPTGPLDPPGTVVGSPEDARLAAARSTGRPDLSAHGLEILDELGRGGMGVVYRARQRTLNRTVAVKMVLAGRYADPAVRSRFLIECEAVAALDHQHIVNVYAFGESDGYPFLAMEYLPGGSLGDHWGKFEPRRAAEVLLKLADAVGAAHARGIIHRDLKPGNVLFTAAGEPKVADFGLAKVGEGELTGTGEIMGTPSYMAPEQATGRTREVGPAADVWALGVILYEYLTGRLPFKGNTTQATLQKVVTEEPVRPRILAPRVPKDLETVCLKCLEKQPGGRYPTAAALAGELKRYLAGEPVLARPVGRVERLVRWGRRKPTLAAAYGLIVVAAALSGGVAAAVRLWRDAETARGQAEQARDETEFLNYAHLIRLANAEQQAGDFLNARSHLAACPDRLRGWEWRCVHRLCHPDLLTLRGHTGPVRSVVFSPDGRRLATAGADDSTARVWDSETGRELFALRGHTGKVRSVAFSPDGSRVVTAGEDGVPRVWDSIAGREILALRGRSGEVWWAVFSPDARQVLTVGDSGIVLWDAATGSVNRELMKRIILHPANVFSPDGRRVVTGTFIWDAGTGKELLTLRGQKGEVVSAAFSPDGQRVVTAARGAGFDENTACVWNAETGEELVVLRGHTDSLVAAAFSSNGKWVVTAGGLDKTARVWNAQTGEERAVLRGHPAGVRSAMFSPDGRRVLTVGLDRVARLWETESGYENRVLRGHEAEVTTAVFSPDGRRVVTASLDGTARMWDVSSYWKDGVLRGASGGAGAAAVFSPDGRRVLTTKLGDTSVGLWDSKTGQSLRDFRGGADVFRITSAAFSPDGKRVITAGDYSSPVPVPIDDEDERADPKKVVRPKDREVCRVMDADTGRVLLSLRSRRGQVLSAAYSPDGRQVVTTGYGGTVLWDAGSGKELRALHGPTLSGPGRAAQSVAFSADGRRVVTAGGEKEPARIYDVETGQEVLALGGQDGGIASAVFSPNGKQVITTSHNRGDQTARVWDTGSGREVLALRGHNGGVRSAGVSPDGQRLVTVGEDKIVRVWDAETGKELLTLPDGLAAQFSPDGARVLVIGPDNILIYDSTPVNREFLPTEASPPAS